MSHWLEDYAEWAADCTDAPAVFHKWGGYMALASALGRRATFKFGPFDIAPNLYVLLLAPSSIYRKSTALNLSKRIAGKVGAYDLAGDGSPEGFIEDLKQHPQGTLYYSELAVLLAQFGREYSAALRPLLTELYDTPQDYRRKLRNEEIHVVNPCVNLFAASVLDWVLERMKQSDFAGGFLTRFILVSATAKEKSFAIPPAAVADRENRLVAALHLIVQSVNGEVSLEPVRGLYEKWAAGFEKRARTPLLAAFLSRLQVAAVKLAMLEQASESASTALTADALDRAIAAIEGIADTTAALEENELGYANDRDGQDQRNVARIVRMRESIGMTELQRNSHLSSDRMHRALRTLSECGSVEISSYPQPRQGRPLRVVNWRGNGVRD